MKLLKYFAFALITATIFACDKQPTACFNVPEQWDLSTLESANCSEGSFFHWSASNGSYSLEKEPLFIFPDTGTFTISLWAYSRNGYKVDSLTKSIRIDRRYVDSLVVEYIAPTKPSGENWDNDGSNPDLFISILNASRYFINYNPVNVPFTWNLSNLNKELKQEITALYVYDDDNAPSTSENDLIELFQFDPYLKNESPITIDEPLFKAKLYWSRRVPL